MLLNRPTLLQLPGEGGRGRSLFSAGGCGPRPRTGAAVSSSPARRREHRGPTCFSGWPGAPSWRAASAQGRRAEAQGQPSRLRPRRRRASARLRPPRPRRPRALAPPARRPAGSLQYLLQLVLAGTGRDAQDVVQLRVGHVRHGGLPGSTRKQAAERKERDPDHERRRRRPRRRRGEAGGAEL